MAIILFDLHRLNGCCKIRWRVQRAYAAQHGLSLPAIAEFTT